LVILRWFIPVVFTVQPEVQYTQPTHICWLYLINKSCVWSEYIVLYYTFKIIILSGSVGKVEVQTRSVKWLHTKKSIYARSLGSYVEGGRLCNFHCYSIVLKLFISHNTSFDVFMNGSLYLPITNKMLSCSYCSFKEKM